MSSGKCEEPRDADLRCVLVRILISVDGNNILACVQYSLNPGTESCRGPAGPVLHWSDLLEHLGRAPDADWNKSDLLSSLCQLHISLFCPVQYNKRHELCSEFGLTNRYTS